MNKNKIIALAVGFTFFVSATPNVYAKSISSTSSTAISVGSVTKTTIITIDLSGDNKTKFLADLGLTEEEFSAFGLAKGKGGKKTELSEEERNAKLEERAEELGITVEELKAQVPTKGERPISSTMTEAEKELKKANRPNGQGRFVCLSQNDIDDLENATGIAEDELLELLKAYEATK